LSEENYPVSSMSLKKNEPELSALLKAFNSKGSKRSLGSHVRKLRKAANLTLAKLSKASGLSLSAISKIENNQISPTFVNLIRLAEGLKMHIADLVTFEQSVHAPSARFSITRRSEQAFTKADHYGFSALCSSLQHKKMKPLITRVKPETEDYPVEKVAHHGEEFIYVLEGAIDIRTEYYKPVQLDKGDSMYFDSSMPHCYVSSNDQEAEAFVMWLPDPNHSEDEVNEVMGNVAKIRNPQTR
jgi:transcriptional regulator with XRE-family HTH domain